MARRSSTDRDDEQCRRNEEDERCEIRRTRHDALLCCGATMMQRVRAGKACMECASRRALVRRID
jgi:hypothetical protein